MRNGDTSATVVRFDLALVQCTLVCGVVNNQMVVCIRLPREAKILTGPRPAETAHRQWRTVPWVRDAFDEIENHPRLDLGLLHHSGIRHKKIFGWIFDKEFHLAGDSKNGLDVRESVPHDRVRELFGKPVEVHLKFELGHLLNRKITELFHQVALDFVTGLFLGGLVPTPFAHGEVAISYEPCESRLWIWPLH